MGNPQLYVSGKKPIVPYCIGYPIVISIVICEYKVGQDAPLKDFAWYLRNQCHKLIRVHTEHNQWSLPIDKNEG